MKKFIILFTVWLFSLSPLKAQFFCNSEDTIAYSPLQDKYWRYRQRLTRYFVKVGDGIGESVVSNVRNRFKRSERALTYSDQTIDLAWYISILATEYALLEQNNQRVEGTLQELYYALKAFDRLDACEKNPPWYQKEAKLDGFFQRYDVLLDSLPQLFSLKGRNPYLTPKDTWGTRAPGMPTYISSYDYEVGKVNYYSPSVSQDQIVHLLMGFALVQKCLPDQFLFFSKVNGKQMGFNFKKDVEEKMYRLFEYIKRDRVWILKDPNNQSVTRGHNAMMYAYPLRALAWKTIGFEYEDTWSSSFMARQMWNLSRVPNWVNDYNSTMALILASLTDTWVDISPFVRINNTGFYISKCGSPWDRETLFLLLYQFYNDKTTSWYDKGKVVKQLDSAPCNGPYYWSQDSVYFSCCGKVPGKPQGGWCYPNKFRATKKEQNGLGKNVLCGNFSGVDYLLLYNLFHLIEQPIRYVKSEY